MVDYALLEDQRKIAELNGDNLRYYHLCKQLGIEPEKLTPSELTSYEAGMVDEVMESRRKRTVPYQTFYNKGNRLNSDFESDTKQKKENLRNFFTGKKRKGLDDLTAFDIGLLHHKILIYSETRLQKVH